MNTSPATGLSPVLDEITRLVRGGSRRLAIRVQRADGSTVEGVYGDIGDSTLAIHVGKSDALVEIPFHAIRRLWLPEVVAFRFKLYRALALLGGIATVVISSQLPGRPIAAGILLGVAVWLALMLAAWFPPVHSWIVVWRLRYAIGDPG